MPRTSDDMPTLATASPTQQQPLHRRRRSWARKVERCCCRTAAHFPLLFVYGLTTWGLWVETSVAFLGMQYTWWSYLKAGFGVTLWALANVSYTIAVFTNPGSPLDPREDLSKAYGSGRKGYEGLPTYEDEEHDEDGIPHGMTTVTAKSSTGKPRYCKKCRTVKPDRTHHCSTCGRCVLKMDHHCPWLATCVGLRNYKPFLLFLIHTSLFCWLCFGTSASWVWAEIMDETQMQQGLRVVNTILLAVLGGIIGLVLSCFTGWHIYLAVSGQTTIESLEKTRYLSPLRKSMQHQAQAQRHYLGQGNEDQPLGDRLKEIHANALPGILRPEEGEDSRRTSVNSTPAPIQPTFQPNGSPAKDSLQRSYASLEEQRERERYDAYLDEQDSERLPNAFSLGWKRNLLHVFGNRPLLWALPVCNTSGDGWQWEVSPKWIEARDELALQRAQRRREDMQWDQQPNFAAPPPGRDYRWQPGQGFVDQARNAGTPSTYMNGGHDEQTTNVQMQPLDRRKAQAQDDDVDSSYDTSSDEEVKRMYNHVGIQGHGSGKGSANWNDVPDDLLAPNESGKGRSQSRGRRKGD